MMVQYYLYTYVLYLDHEPVGSCHMGRRARDRASARASCMSRADYFLAGACQTRSLKDSWQLTPTERFITKCHVMALYIRREAVEDRGSRSKYRSLSKPNPRRSRMLSDHSESGESDDEVDSDGGSDRDSCPESDESSVTLSPINCWLFKEVT